MTNEPLRHHYVPQFYLRSFTGPEGRLNVFHKKDQREFQTSPKNVAVSEKFYDFTPDSEQEVEKKLAKMEDIHSDIYHEFVNYISDRKPLQDFEMFPELCRMIAIQDFRTWNFRDITQNSSKQFFEEINENHLDENVRDFIKNHQTKHGALGFQMLLISIASRPFAQVLVDSTRTIHVNQTSDAFWTSDHPVTRYYPKHETPYQIFGQIGVGSSGWELYYPLTPYHSLVLRDPNTTTNNSDYNIIDSTDSVNHHNNLQFEQSTFQVYSSDKDFSYARQLSQSR